MKDIISIVVMVSLLIMMSCTGDFLHISPASELTTERIFKTDHDFDVAVNGVYSELQRFYDYFWQFGDLRGDDCVQLALRSTEPVNMDNFFTDVNADIIHDAWHDLYQIIASANIVLFKLEEADVSIITGKEQYIGEAKFLRALAYFNLVRIFGDVPMITAPITVEDALKTSRTDVDIIYDDIIINDLLDAEVKLPVTYSSEDVGRATKGAAKSLLGKVYLTRHNFDLAASKLMEVTAMGYALLDDFEYLFDFDNEHHSEYIFDVEYIDGNIGLGSSFTATFMGHDQDIGSHFVDIIREVYNYQGDRGGSGSGSPSEELLDLFDPNDLRKDRTAATGIYDVEGNWVEPDPGAEVTSLTFKYAEYGYIFGESDGKENWRVIRYADVLLMLAEALNEIGRTAEALTYLNKVRIRAGLSGYSGLTQSEARSKIYLERRFELHMEGKRWFDLVRTGRALDVMEPHGMKPYMTVFPVPQSQIEIVNDPSILSQNPGY